MINKIAELLKWNLCFAWIIDCLDNWCQLSGPEKLVVFKKRPALLRWNLLGSISSESVHGSCGQSCTLSWQLNLEVWESSRGHGLQIKAWPCVAGLEFPKRSQKKLLVKVQPSCSKRPQYFRDVNTMRHQEQQQWWNGASQSLETSCVCFRGQIQRCDPSPMEDPRTLWMGPRHWTLS
jgi:hypothetical protein